jgi:exo-beta-1,3-glucanase (GH17 family)
LFIVYNVDAGVVGVSYGQLGNDLPDTASVVKLLQKSGITSVRLYDANSTVLKALANTGITVMVMLPNDKLAAAAADPSSARRWVQGNVAAYYPATRIHGVAVGNEVFEEAKNLTGQLVPAMANVHDALVRLGLDEAVKVSTPIAFTALQESWPPSKGRFRDDIAQSVMKPMVDFLERTGSYLTVNAYPFFAYTAEPDKISLDYALGNSNATGVRDTGTGLVYHSLLDAQLDATYFAMEKLGTSRSSAQEQNSMAQIYLSAYVSETGWPSAGNLQPGVRRLERAGVANAQAASVANAQAYNNYLINRVLSGDTGTPYRPDADMDVYIFSLFNENQKGDGANDIEQHFGLFYPNQTKVYEFDFRGGALASWCVANASVGDARLQAALDYACGDGADCSAIQPGAVCFEPDTKLAHASYAFNSFYQRKGRAKGACDFDGAAYVVYHQPAGEFSASLANCLSDWPLVLVVWQHFTWCFRALSVTLYRRRNL